MRCAHALFEPGAGASSLMHINQTTDQFLDRPGWCRPGIGVCRGGAVVQLDRHDSPPRGGDVPPVGCQRHRRERDHGKVEPVRRHAALLCDRSCDQRAHPTQAAVRRRAHELRLWRRRFLASQWGEVVARSPAEFVAYIRRESERCAKVVQESGIGADQWPYGYGRCIRQVPVLAWRTSGDGAQVPPGNAPSFSAAQSAIQSTTSGVLSAPQCSAPPSASRKIFSSRPTLFTASS